MAKTKSSKSVSKKGKKSGKRSNTASGPPVASTSYSGPITVPNEKHGRDTIIRLFGATGTLTCDAGGVLATVFTSDPTTAANGISTVFSSFQSEWDQYRTLGIELHFQPIVQYNRVTTELVTPGFVVQDYDDTGALASAGSAAQYADAQFVNLSKPWKCVWKAATLPLMEFVSTAGSPNEVGAIKLRFEGLSNTVLMGRYWVKYLIQFKATI